MRAVRSADRVAIGELLGDYADAVNRRDPDHLRAVFTPDGVWDLGTLGVHRGVEEVVAALRVMIDGWQGLTHLPHTGLVRFDPDDESVASGRWYFSELGVMGDGEEAYFAGVYHDDYRRDGDGDWRFAMRRYGGLFSRRGATVAVRPFPTDVPAVWS